jgi:hypothetical protein
MQSDTLLMAVIVLGFMVVLLAVLLVMVALSEYIPSVGGGGTPAGNGTTNQTGGTGNQTGSGNASPSGNQTANETAPTEPESNKTVAEAYAAGETVKCRLSFAAANASKLGMATPPDKMNGTILFRQGKTRWDLDAYFGAAYMKESSMSESDYIITEMTDYKIEAINLDSLPDYFGFRDRAKDALRACDWLKVGEDMLPAQVTELFAAIDLIRTDMTIADIERTYANKGISMDCAYADVPASAFIISGYCTYDDVIRNVLFG